MVVTELTSGVQISVENIYRKDLSNIEDNQYFFNYRVVIENTNLFEVQLKSRNWFIFDSLQLPREVKGDGVVGEQPILKPSEKHVYVSGCDLSSEVGYMRGYYTFERIDTQEEFRVQIPRFIMMATLKMN